MANSQYEYSTFFPLGNFYNEYVNSVKFQTERVNIVPVMSEFAVSGLDPSGSRHLTTHGSFSETLASGRGIASLDFGELDMSVTDISLGSGVSRTRCFIFRIDQFDCSTSRVHNLKVWVSSDTDFLVKNAHRFLFHTSSKWLQDFAFPVSALSPASGQHFLQTSLPDKPNLKRQDGGFTIYDTNDSHCSQYVYVGVVASGVTLLGQFGNTSASGLLFRVTYSLDNIPLRD